MIIFVIVLVIIVIFVIFFLRHPQFGARPTGKRREKILRSSNFKNGKFENQSFTPQLVEGFRMSGVLYMMLFKRVATRKPPAPIPAIRTDLHHLPGEDLLIWFGHSSCFLQLNGKRILVDPVFSNSASPIPGTNKPFPGTNIFRADDFPFIDYLLITHDHYDHLDYKTIRQFNGKFGKIICGLGVGAHLEHWGIKDSAIIEEDWNSQIGLEGMTIFTAPARHFSGRSFSRNNTLWLSYIIQSGNRKIYVGGDSGYDKHFKETGDLFGPFDIAILDNGQYNEAWRYIHALPDEVLKAAGDLRALRLLPVHSGKFVMANHPWDEPLTRITELNNGNDLNIMTPMIGEIVYLDDNNQKFTEWWKLNKFNSVNS